MSHLATYSQHPSYFVVLVTDTASDMNYLRRLSETWNAHNYYADSAKMSHYGLFSVRSCYRHMFGDCLRCHDSSDCHVLMSRHAVPIIIIIVIEFTTPSFGMLSSDSCRMFTVLSYM